MQLYLVIYVEVNHDLARALLDEQTDWTFDKKEPVKILIYTGEQYGSTQEFIRKATSDEHSETYANNTWELKSERGGSEEISFEYEKKLKVKKGRSQQLDLLTDNEPEKKTIDLDTTEFGKPKSSIPGEVDA